MKLKKFMIIVFELFIVLKLYSVWHNLTGLSMGSYLIIVFILFWILNYWLGQIGLTRTVSSTFYFKLLPRMRFTNEWFGILLLAVVVTGFFLSQIIQWLVVKVIFALLCGYGAWHFMRNRDDQQKDVGLLFLGAVFGLAIGSPLTNNATIVVIFILGNIFLYFLSVPNERQHYI